MSEHQQNEMPLKDHMIWQHWDLPFSKHSHEILKVINVKSGDNVLDCAVGEGRYAIPMSKLGANVTGVDNSDFIIDRLNQKVEKKDVQVEVVKQDLREDLSFADNTFDISASLGTMIHIDQFENVAKELYRVTKPGGRVVIEFSNKFHITSFLEKTYQLIDLKIRKKKFDSRAPIYMRSFNEMKKPFEDKDCSMKTYGFYPVLPNGLPVIGAKGGINQLIPGLSYGFKNQQWIHQFCQIGIIEIIKHH